MRSVRDAYDIEIDADRITREFFRDRVAELFADAAVWIVESGMHQYGDGRGGVVYEMLHEAVACHLGDNWDGRGRSSSPPKRKQISMTKRLAVLRRDGYRCVECGTDNDLSIDHIVPVAKGGGDEMENLRTLCRPCNSRKGAR